MNRISALIAAILIPSVVYGGGAECSACHERQHLQWQESLHARSTDDPLYRAMTGWAGRDAGAETVRMCANCHTTAKGGSNERTEAVTCEACHQGRAAAPGPPGWRVDLQLPIAAARPSAEAPHAVNIDHGLTSGRLCLVCHGELHNPHGVPLCTTGPEAAQRNSPVTCLGCHMREADHRIPGATPELLRQAAQIALNIRQGEAVVTVMNRGAGHALPTGPVLRQVRLEVELLDASSNPVERHAEVFARVLEDENGNAPAPPWRAVRVRSSTPLMPQETRRFSYPIPEGAAAISARLVFHRAPSPLVEKLGLQDEPMLQPIVMARMERQLR
jgi:hypothetical protein